MLDQRVSKGRSRCDVPTKGYRSPCEQMILLADQVHIMLAFGYISLEKYWSNSPNRRVLCECECEC